MDLEVSVRHDGSVAIVALAGMADLATVPALREALQPLLPPQTERVIVDASELTALAPTCSAEIDAASKRLRDRGGELVVAGASTAVTSALGSGVRFADSVQEARG